MGFQFIFIDKIVTLTDSLQSPAMISFTTGEYATMPLQHVNNIVPSKTTDYANTVT